MLKAMLTLAIITGALVYLLFSSAMNFATDLRDYQEQKIEQVLSK